MAQIFIPEFRDIDSTKGPITIVLSSEGGIESAGYAIFDVIREAQNETTIKGYGAVMSIAAAILQAGTKRLLAPYCRFMIHNGTVPLPVKAGDEIDTTKLIYKAKEAEAMNEIYYDILARRSLLDTEEVADLCERDTYYSAEQAIEAGFADDLTTESK